MILKDIFEVDKSWLSNHHIIVFVVADNQQLNGKTPGILHIREFLIAGVSSGWVESVSKYLHQISAFHKWLLSDIQTVNIKSTLIAINKQ